MALIERARRYMQLGRVFSAMLTAGIAIIGAYSTGETLSIKLFLALMWFGFWYHAYGGALNELIDLDLDSKVKELSDKPLVSGAIARNQAYAFTLVCIFAGLLPLAYLFPHPWTIGLWTMSYIAGGYYDIKGKYTPFMFELSLGFTFFSWALFGAALVRPDFLDGVTLNTIAVSCMIFAYAVYINWGNAMKDAPTDRFLKVPTRAVAWGYDHKQRLGPFSSHILYGFFIKAFLLASFAIPIYAPVFHQIPMTSGIPVLASQPLFLGLDIYAIFFIFFVVPSQLWIVLQATGVHGRKWWRNYIVKDIFLTWLAFSFMTVMVVGVWWSIFMFLFPFLWFAATTTVMYGKPMRLGL